MLQELLALFLVLIGIWMFRNKWRYSSTLPPGPFPFPLLGSIPQLALGMRNLSPFVGFTKMSKIYGQIIGIHYGKRYQVVVHDPEMIREILCNEIWVNRIQDEYVAERSFGKSLGIIFISGDVWKEMRRFTMRTLRDFGFGKKKSMEASLAEEMSDFSSRLDDQLEKGPICMTKIFTIPVLNVLWAMIAGYRFSHDNKKLGELIGLIDATNKANPIKGNIIMAFPFLRHFLPKLTAKGRLRTHFIERMHEFFREILNERRREGIYKEEQRDFIDVFLKEIDDHAADTSEKNYYTDEQFIMVSFDLFVAGADTTANTLEFAMLYMILNPKVQKKVQEEIDRVLGKSRSPSLQDKSEMPYTEATLLEVQRLANVLPMIIRSNTEPTALGNYKVPTATVAILNTYSMHMDQSTWDEPDKMKPERFLDKSTGAVINANKILPFGLGKRVCLGEVLARATLFSFFTSLLQKYTWELAGDNCSNENGKLTSTPSTEPVLGFTLSPQAYKVQLRLR